jgi:hypothetical protein
LRAHKVGKTILFVTNGKQLLALASIIRQRSCNGGEGQLRMREAALTQLILIGLLAVVWAAFVTRVVIFFRREYAGVRLVYPSAWTALQCRALEYFRRVVGLALIPLWVIYLLIAPSVPAGWLEYVEVISLISMLVISYAWVILLTPSDWRKLDAFPQSFWLTIAFLMIWWGMAFTAVGWMFAEASASPPLRTYSGVFAAQSDIPYRACDGCEQRAVAASQVEIIKGRAARR